jgi:hypothetical protein
MAGLTRLFPVCAPICIVATLWSAAAFAQGMGPIGPGLTPPASTSQGPPPVSSNPEDGLQEPEDQMRAKGLKECKVGDRVIARHEGKWISAQVIAVNPAERYPCKVHLIGRPPTLDSSFATWMLRPQPESR